MAVEAPHLVIDGRVVCMQALRVLEEELGDDGEELRRAFRGIGIDGGTVVGWQLGTPTIHPPRRAVFSPPWPAEDGPTVSAQSGTPTN